jgi:hypothetical protein
MTRPSLQQLSGSSERPLLREPESSDLRCTEYCTRGHNFQKSAEMSHNLDPSSKVTILCYILSVDENANPVTTGHRIHLTFTVITTNNCDSPSYSESGGNYSTQDFCIH